MTCDVLDEVIKRRRYKTGDLVVRRNDGAMKQRRTRQAKPLFPSFDHSKMAFVFYPRLLHSQAMTLMTLGTFPFVWNTAQLAKDFILKNQTACAIPDLVPLSWVFWLR